MKTIIVLGATGQVGTELCVTLSVMPGVRVIAVCRSELAGALLRRCGIECRVGSILSDAQRLLDGADVIFDLALPQGMTSEIRSKNRDLIEATVSQCPKGSSYVYASSIMALGVAYARDQFDHKWISKTSYGANKRYLEKVALRAGRDCGKPVFVFRLGDVHGVMQNVSRYLLDAARRGKVALPEGPSNSIFVFSIAEALIGIANGQELPGVFMLTSDPQWTWSDLYSYFAGKAHISSEIIEVRNIPTPWLVKLKRNAAARLLKYREQLTGYILARLPALEMRAKARHLVHRAMSETNTVPPILSPYDRMNYGNAPGRRPSSLTDSRQTMEPVLAKVAQILGSAAR